MTEAISKARSRLRRWVGRGVSEPFDHLRDQIRDELAGLEARLGAQVASIHAEVHAEVARAYRLEAAEMVRMLRQQGDASDEVAETLGRILARLSAEVEALSRALEGLQERLDLQSAPPDGALRRRVSQPGNAGSPNPAESGAASPRR